MKSLILKNKYFLNILILTLSVWCAYSLMKWYSVDIQYIIFSFVVYGMFLMFKSVIKYKLKFNWLLFLLSLIIPIFIIIGDSIIKTDIISTENFLFVDLFKKVNTFFSFVVLFYSFILLLINYIERNAIIIRHQENKKIFFLLWLGIFLVFSFYFVCYYPGIMSPDSLNQWGQALGDIPLSNHHPIAHTSIITIFYHIGGMFNNYILGVALYSLFQMIFVSFTLAYSIYYLYRKGMNLILTFLCFLYFAINPIHGFYSITMWKDIWFGCFSLLLFISLLEFSFTNGNNILEKKWKYLFIISLIGVGLFRSNGIYVIIALIPIMLYMGRKYLNKLIFMFSICIIPIIFIRGPLLEILDIRTGRFAESIGISIKQVASVVVNDESLSAKQKNEINLVLPIEIIKEKYHAISVDTLKFDEHFNDDYLEANKLYFATLWTQLAINHPITYIQTYLRSTIGFWYPISWGSGIEYGIFQNQYNLRTNSLFTFGKEKLVSYTNLINVNSFSRFLFNEAIIIWLLLFSFIVCLYQKKYKFLLPLSLLFLIWVTVMIATPLGYSTRYVYSIILTPHILLFIIFHTNEKKKVI